MQKKGIVDAAMKGDAERLRNLILEGAAVDETHRETLAFGKSIVAVHSCTALMAAAAEGHAEAARVLLEADSDPNCAADNGVTALHLAAMMDHPAVVELLARRGANLNAVIKPAETPLLCALSMNSFAAATALIRAGCDVRAKDGYVGDTALHRIATIRKADAAMLECFTALLGAGADPNARNSILQTPLHYAATASPESVRLLLDHGADPTAEDFMKRTPLQNAYKNVETVRLLLSAGAEPNHADQLGRTVLHDAVRSKQEDVIRELVAAGSDVNRKQDDGTDALSIAATSGKQEVVELLQGLAEKTDFNASALNEQLCNACRSGEIERVRKLLLQGADPNSSPDPADGMTCLLIATRSGSEEICTILQEAGASHPLASHFLEIPQFRNRLKRPEIQKAIQDLAKLCAAKPLAGPSGAVMLFEVPGSAASRKRLGESNASDAAIHSILGRARKKFLKRGCLLLFHSHPSGNKLALVPTTDSLAAVAWLGPHPKGAASMIEFLLKLSKAWTWTLLGCSSNELQLHFPGKPKRAPELAKRLYGLRSDEKGVVRKGIVHAADSMKDLAKLLSSPDPIVRLRWK